MSQCAIKSNFITWINYIINYIASRMNTLACSLSPPLNKKKTLLMMSSCKIITFRCLWVSNLILCLLDLHLHGYSVYWNCLHFAQIILNNFSDHMNIHYDYNNIFLQDCVQFWLRAWLMLQCFFLYHDQTYYRSIFSYDNDIGECFF